MDLEFSSYGVNLPLSVNASFPLPCTIQSSKQFGMSMLLIDRSCTRGRCSCGGYNSVEEFVKFELLMTFLMGLNESYAHIRVHILLMDPPHSLIKAFSLIFEEEQ